MIVLTAAPPPRSASSSDDAAAALAHAPAQRRVPRELFRRTSRPGHQLAAAIRAAAGERALHAVAAEGALERADEGLAGRRRQVAVTAFAVGSQLEHGRLALGGGADRQRGLGALVQHVED